MSKHFKLIEEKFSKNDKERQRTYELKIIFNYQLIKKVTITDHYLVNHKEVINNQLIMKLLAEMDGEILEPTKYQGERKVFKWENDYQNKYYRLTFWFENSNSDWLWVRNYYPID